MGERQKGDEVQAEGESETQAPSMQPSHLGRIPAIPGVDGAIVGSAMCVSLVLTWLHLSVPSLWHDELVHTFVAEHLAQTGRPALPSGEAYYNGTTFHLLLAAVIKVFGVSEWSVRAPSGIFAALNVGLTYLIVRPLLGRWPAIVAAVGLAMSPWSVAWGREARFYTLQQTCYLVFLLSFWRLGLDRHGKRIVVMAICCVTAYALAVATSYHSVLFLAAPGVFVAGVMLYERRLNRRWLALLVGGGLLGALTLAGVHLAMNTVDREAVVNNSGLGGSLVDSARSARLYYTLWLRQNLGTGFFVLAIFGFGAMCLREGRRGVLSALAFWAPVLVLTFVIGYRRPRFMYFAYPFYVAAWSYGLVVLVVWLRKPKPTWAPRIAAAALVLFSLRLAWSFGALSLDSAEAASGAHTTLARRHPQWRAPAQWVRERLAPDRVVITTTFLPVQYYVGRVDTWYPSRGLRWEADESGLEGIEDAAGLAEYVTEHPKGYFLAEWWRFERNYAGAPWADFSEDIAWVQAHMTRVDAASSDDVTVYAWGIDAGGT